MILVEGKEPPVWRLSNAWKAEDPVDGSGEGDRTGEEIGGPIWEVAAEANGFGSTEGRRGESVG
jgi:hypothetical protein